MDEANRHTTVLLHEAVDALAVKPDGVYVDGTFGRGGHSREILARLGPEGRLIALDQDPASVPFGQAIHDERFSMIHSSFSRLREVLKQLKVDKVDGVLLDLGVSSPQLDNAERGFSFRLEGPLDMRMDTSEGQTAAEWLATASLGHLEEVIRNYGEERFAKQIARAVVAARAQRPITTTAQLASIVAEAIPARSRQIKPNPATRTFQAIRIFLNQELEKLSLALPQCVEMLNAGGRLVVISFHSLEDRIVKRFMRRMAVLDTLPRRLPLRSPDLSILAKPKLLLAGKALRAPQEEIHANPRARSAIMRVAEKVVEA